MEMIYVGFWRRLVAMLVDLLILLPYLFVWWIFDALRLPFIIPALFSVIFTAWYAIYLVQKFGGTPGKLIMGIRIAMLDGSKVTARAAVMRYAVLFCTSTLLALAMAMSSFSLEGTPSYETLDFIDKQIKLKAVAPAWYGLVHWLEQIWIWSEFITMLFNKKRRALHDFMAGTVVIRTQKQFANEPA